MFSCILKETTVLIHKKNGTFGNIPTKRLKEKVSNIYTPTVNDIWNKERVTQKKVFLIILN